MNPENLPPAPAPVPPAKLFSDAEVQAALARLKAKAAAQQATAAAPPQPVAPEAVEMSAEELAANPEEARRRFEAALAGLREASVKWVAAKEEQFEQLLEFGWSGEHDLASFLKQMEQESQRLEAETDRAEEEVFSAAETMKAEDEYERLEAMKKEWARLRVQGAPRTRWPLDAGLPFGLQFAAMEEVERGATQGRATDTNEDAANQPTSFGLFPLDKPIQTRLLDACRAMLKRATPAQVRDLAYLIYALQRLPSTTPGVSGGVTLATRHGESAAYRGFELNGDEFTLTTGESVDMGCGTDHGFRNVLEVGTSAMRDIEYGDDFTEWLDLFCEQAEDEATEIEIFCDAADSVNLSENTEGLPWEENPLLDEI